MEKKKKLRKIEIILALVAFFSFAVFLVIVVYGKRVSETPAEIHKDFAYHWAYDMMRQIKSKDFSAIQTGIWKPDKESPRGEKVTLTRVVQVREEEKGLKKVDVEVLWNEPDVGTILIKVSNIIRDEKNKR